LIVECNKAAILFDQYHCGNPLFVSQAIDHIKDFAQWAWGVCQGKIPAMTFTLDPTNPKVSHYKVTRIQHCSIINIPSISNASGNPTPVGAPPDFNNQTNAILLQLAHGISRQKR
jgi:hypothetical protein